MLFSIIIPVYNVEKYLNECLDSIMGQNFTDYEVILVNDGSADRSGEICDAFSKKHSQISVVHQRNQGQAVARNVGTELAKGKYVVFLDSDDYILDCDFLKKLAVKSYSNPDVILYGYKKYYENKQKFGTAVCDFPDVSKISEPQEVIRELLRKDLYDGSPWSKAVRRDLLIEHDIRFPSGRISEDSDWYLQIVLIAQKYENINEAFVAYRQRQNSISQAPKLQSLTDNIDMLERWVETIETNKKIAEMKSALYAILARYYGNIMILYTRIPSKQRKKYLNRIKELRFLLQCSTTNRSKFIQRSVKLLGFRCTISALTLLDKIKNR